MTQNISHCDGPLLEILPNAIFESLYFVVWSYIGPIFHCGSPLLTPKSFDVTRLAGLKLVSD